MYDFIMKILFTTHYHAFQNPGGGETVLLDTKKALENQGVQVKLFNQWEDKISNYDLIHDFSSLNWRNWQGFKSYGPKLVVTPVMWPDTSLQNVLKHKVKSFLKDVSNNHSPEVNFQAALKIPDAFFCTSKLEAEKISSLYDLNINKFKTISNGIFPSSNFNPDSNFSSKLKFKKYFLYVGRISPLKNVDSIINSILLKNKNLLIIGKPDTLDENYGLEIIKKYQNHPQVQIIDSLPHQSYELLTAYKLAEAVIVASQFETCSMVGLEAGSLGTPVIMTDKGATSEYYQNFVRYMNPDDFSTLNKALDYKWSESERLQLQKHILSNFDFRNIATKLISEYEKVLKV